MGKGVHRRGVFTKGAEASLGEVKKVAHLGDIKKRTKRA